MKNFKCSYWQIVGIELKPLDQDPNSSSSWRHVHIHNVLKSCRSLTIAGTAPEDRLLSFYGILLFVAEAIYWDSCFTSMVRVLKDQWLALAIAMTSLGTLVWLELFTWAVQ